MGATDQEIVEAVLAGEQHRYAELVERYRGKIVSYVMRMLGNYDDAVDLSQEVFLKAYTALDSYRPQYPFTAWLFRIARNASIDELRRRRTVRDFSDRPVPRDVIETCLLAAGTAPNGANRQPWHFVVVGDADVVSPALEALGVGPVEVVSAAG